MHATRQQIIGCTHGRRTMTTNEFIGYLCIVVYCPTCRLFRLGKQETSGIENRGGCSKKGSQKEVVSGGGSGAGKKNVNVLLQERCGVGRRAWRSGR